MRKKYAERQLDLVTGEAELANALEKKQRVIRMLEQRFKDAAEKHLVYKKISGLTEAFISRLISGERFVRLSDVKNYLEKTKKGFVLSIDDLPYFSKDDLEHKAILDKYFPHHDFTLSDLQKEYDQDVEDGDEEE